MEGFYLKAATALGLQQNRVRLLTLGPHNDLDAFGPLFLLPRLRSVT